MERNNCYTFYIVEEVKCDVDFEELYRLIKEESGEEFIDNETACEMFNNDMSYYILQFTKENIETYEPINENTADKIYLDFREWLEENHKENENI